MLILIDVSGYKNNNLGDLAMLVVAAQRIREHFPKAAIHVFTTDVERLKIYVPDVLPLDPFGRDKWFEVEIPEFIRSVTIRKIFNKFIKIKLREILIEWPKFAYFIRVGISKVNPNYDRRAIYFYDLVRKSDAVIASGGGYFCDDFSWRANFILDTLYLGQKLKVPTAIFGQGIGPITKPDLIRNIKKTLPGLKMIGLREALSSMPFLEKNIMDPLPLMVTGDDAIELAISISEMKTSKMSVGPIIGLNIRTANYAGEFSDHLSKLSKIINFVNQGHNTLFIPVPIHIGDGDRDLINTNKVYYFEVEEFEEGKKINCVEGLLKQINRCDLIITGSYHAGVFALSLGIPVIALVASDYYRNKFSGLLDQFGQGLVIYEYDQIGNSSKLIEIIKFYLLHSKDNRSSLIEQGKRQVLLSRFCWSKFLTSIEVSGI